MELHTLGGYVLLVRPIAAGEVSRRIMCRAVMKIIKSDVRDTTEPRQLCVGVPSACEASVHAMDSLFNLDSTDGILGKVTR